MTTPRFFSPDPLPQGNELALSPAVAHHATRVLRLVEGARIVLFDGSGEEIRAVLLKKDGQWYAQVSSRQPEDRESSLETVLLQALASGDKMDWIVQKATELGVSAIIPLRTERCVLKLSREREEKRLLHWRQIAISACEQSGRNRIPTIFPVTPLPDYLNAPTQAIRLVLAPGAETRLSALPASAQTRLPQPMHILIGPEGGWSDGELAACRSAACIFVSLGPRVLRTETAGLAALAALQTCRGDF